MSKLFSALNELKTNIFGGQSYVRTDTPGSSNGVNILRKSNIEMLERSPTSRLDNDPLAFSTIAYPHDIVADGTNGHYMLFYVNVQNQTKFAANYKTPAGLTVEEKVAGQNYGAEQMAAGQAPARSFTKEQALLEGKGTSLSNVKELARGNKTLSNGNLSISGASDNQMVVGTMHSDAGYYEVKMTGTSHGSGGKGARIGLCKVDGSHPITYTGISGNSGDLEKFIGVQTANGNYKAIYNNGYEVTNYSSDSWSQNDILQVAWKNNKIWYGVNGTWLGSGNPSAGTNEADTLTSGSMYVPAIISSLAGADGSQFNFGNGYFGTTAISSEGTNASGIGKFEYDVPTGCTAVSTKGLNE